MPIDTVQHLIHLRTRKNQKVMRNIDRLWEIAHRAKTPQDVLDALHPWGEYSGLRFNNLLPKCCVAIAFMTGIFGYLLDAYFPLYISIFITFLWCSVAYFCYESDAPIEAVIEHLELQMKLLKHHLDFQKMPEHLGRSSSYQVLAQLKEIFPLFNQGNVSNQIISFASTTWEDQDQHSYPVLLYKYVYVTEISVRDMENNKYKLKKIEKELSGAFIFGTPALGFAVSNRKTTLPEPYVHHWRSSDIQLNHQLKIYGSDPHQIAKSVSPSMTLKLAHFFEQYRGELIFHHHQKVMCFMGEYSIFETRSRRKRDKISNISDLRGYIRTLEMANYEQFKQSMLNLLP